MFNSHNSLQDDHSILQDLMWHWLNVALLLIRSQGQFFVRDRSQYINQSSTHQILERRYDCILDATTTLKTVELPEWQVFEAQLLKTQAGANRLHMTISSGRTVSTLRPVDIAESFIHPLLKSDSSAACSIADPIRSDFSVLFNDFMTSLMQDCQTFCDSLYISGVTLEFTNILEINNELTIERVSNDELLSILQHDAPLTMATTIIYSNVKNRCLCIRRRFRLQLCIGDDNDASNPLLPTGYEETDAFFTSVLEALALIGANNVKSIAHTIRALGPFAGSGESHRYIPNDVLGSHDCSAISNEAAKELVAVLKSVFTVHKNKSRFELPLQYTLSATRRKIFAEKLIDLSIAAEAMLNDNKDGQLLYRFALRGALLLSKDPSIRLHLFRLLRAAYGARSTIVHGNAVSERKLNLSSLVTEFEPVVQKIFLALVAHDPLKRPSELDWTRFELGGDLAEKLSKF